MRTAVMTMAYNEGVILPKWVKYYGQIFGKENLFIFDHGSDDGSTENLGAVNIIKLPRTPFSDIVRSKMISSFSASFLSFFDYFIYTDADEFLCVDPVKYINLKNYLHVKAPEHVTAIGLNIFHSFEDEAPLNISRPVLTQRSYAYFLPSMCKTLITKKPTNWGGGFHACNHRQNFDEVYNFHLKQMDREIALDRLRILRSIERDGDFGTHQRIEDAKMNLIFKQINSRDREDNFDFSFEIEELEENISKNHADKYIFNVDYQSRHRNNLRKIPEQFKGIF
ncbi:glycosyltransferase family 2 protein [Paracoccus gahaiensis]|nr:glycosyltransferase family 2 protein [Paracoccus gahaiensis]